MEDVNIGSTILKSGARVGVIGMGVSGFETAKFLLRAGAIPICFEGLDEVLFSEKSAFYPDIIQLRTHGLEIRWGGKWDGITISREGLVAAVISPGVNPYGDLPTALSEAGVPIIGEFELGVELSNLPATIVTGSNGKSTTASLIYDAWIEAGFNSRLCGNVGTPVVSGLLNGDKSDLLVVEASSYQLESCSILKPKVGVFLNLTENHLERHGTMERYRAAKLKLFERQSYTDFAVLNYDDPNIRSACLNLKGEEPNVGAVKGSVIWFGCQLPDSKKISDTDLRYFDSGISIRILYDPAENIDKLNYKFGDVEGFLELCGAPLSGLHHRYNIAAALGAFFALQGPVEAFERAVAKFTGLPHRTQFIGEWNQISVFNDSKSTTVASTTAALSTVLAENPDSNVTLLVGGLVKKGSWQPLFELIKEVRDNRIKPRVIRLICFGKDGPTIHDLANKEGIENLLCGGVRDAISLLPDSTNRDLSVRKREVVLFSPGGASFDEFKDFEQRGDFFTKLVREYFSREE